MMGDRIIMPATWPEFLREVLTQYVTEFDDKIDEFIQFAIDVVKRWESAPDEIRERYALAVNYLMALSEKPNVVRAKLNAFYAYLVFKGYVSAYRLMKEKHVSGGESLYTWLRMYRALYGIEYAHK